jgi:hypothetical protein
MFKLITNYSANIEYHPVSPIAVFEYGMGVGLNTSGFIEQSADGWNAFGIADDRQDQHSSSCINNDVKIWTGDFVFQTDQFVDFGANNVFKYLLNSFLVLENGIWKADGSLTAVICGIVVECPNALNNHLLTIRTAFPLASQLAALPTFIPISNSYQTQFGFDIDVDLPQKKPKTGPNGGAICEECNAENEYLDPVLNHVCRSCLSYREM